MSQIQFGSVTSYIARSYWQRHASGYRLIMPTAHGVVNVYTHEGDDRTPGFTSVEYQSGGMAHRGRLAHCYHRRWLKRVGREFMFLIESTKKDKAA